MNCGPLCIVWLEAQQGHALSLRKARSLCRTTTDGTYAADMVHALDALGYADPRIRENLTWRQLRGLVKRNHVIVAWWTPLENGRVVDPSRWDGHWCVVKRVTARQIAMYDPDADSETVMPRMIFEWLWRDYERHGNYHRPFHHAAVVARKAG